MARNTAATTATMRAAPWRLRATADTPNAGRPRPPQRERKEPTPAELSRTASSERAGLAVGTALSSRSRQSYTPRPGCSRSPRERSSRVSCGSSSIGFWSWRGRVASDRYSGSGEPQTELAVAFSGGHVYVNRLSRLEKGNACLGEERLP